MARITVLGGTGYAGSNIVAVAAQRGHTVTSYSRKKPRKPLAGVDYRKGESNISGADLALAIVQEIETPQHRRARFTVSY